MGLQLDDQDDLGPGKCTQIEVLSSVTGIRALSRNVAVPSSFVGLSDFLAAIACGTGTYLCSIFGNVLYFS